MGDNDEIKKREDDASQVFDLISQLNQEFNKNKSAANCDDCLSLRILAIFSLKPGVDC